MEKKYFNDLTFKEKAEHIWEYYKLHIFGVIALIFIIIFTANLIFQKPSTIFAGVGIYGEYVSDTKLSVFTSDYNTKFNTEAENSTFKFASFYKDPEDPMVEVQRQELFSTMFMTRQLDILIADENYFKFLVNEGYIISLEEILSTEELSEFKNINNLFYSTNKQDPTNKLYGIPMENASGYITQFEEFSCKDKYIGIVRHTERKDNALKVLRDFIK